MEFNEEFLKEVGLAAMPEEEKRAFVEYAQEELEVRLGEEIAKGIEPEKMREFEEADDETALRWLKENKPDYKEIVKKTVSELKDEISRNKDRILG